MDVYKWISEMPESAFRSAFSGVAPDDKLVSLCTNTMKSSATIVVFGGSALENSLTIKESICRPVVGGLDCSPLSVNEKYFTESPKHNFTLEDNITFDEASALLAMFRDNYISGLPDRRSRFNYLNVTSISKTSYGYSLELGDLYCSGCTATLRVSVEQVNGDKPHLVLLGQPEQVCI